MKLLTLSNTKLLKGNDFGYATYGIHLSPSDLSGYNVCPMASLGCRAACLNTSGRGQMQVVQRARLKKTLRFFQDRQGFLADLRKDIKSAIKSAKRQGLTPCFRLNLTSDIQWEKIGIPQEFPDVQFYDYTKIPNRLIDKALPKNYHLTFSRSESNDVAVQQVMEAGGNVAVVFDSKVLPKSYLGVPVINGDEHDVRFIDPTPCVVGLYAKGDGKKDESGFVVSASE